MPDHLVNSNSIIMSMIQLGKIMILHVLGRLNHSPAANSWPPSSDEFPQIFKIISNNEPFPQNEIKLHSVDIDRQPPLL